MFFRHSVKAKNGKGKTTSAKNKMKRLMTRKSGKPKKYIKLALAPEALKDDYFRLTTPEEAEEVNRILAAKNYFDVLEVDHKAELLDQEDELRRSYLSKAMLLNPNKCDHPKLDEAFAKLSKAYDTLKDPEERLEHKYKHFGGRPQDPNTLGALLQSMFQPDADETNTGGGQPRLIFTRPGPNQPMIVRRRQPAVMAGAGGVPPIFRIMDNLLAADENEEPQGEGQQGQQPAQQQQRQRTEPANQAERRDSDELGIENIFAGLFGGGLGRPPPRQTNNQTEARQQPAQRDNEPPRSLFDLLLGGMGRDENEEEEEETRQPQRQPQTQAQPEGPRIMQGPGGIRFIFQPSGGNQAARPAQGGESARTRFAAQLTQLEEMGFSDERRNLQALMATRGNVDAAVNMLIA